MSVSVPKGFNNIFSTDQLTFPNTIDSCTDCYILLIHEDLKQTLNNW